MSNPFNPYEAVIGVTGFMGSGKSSFCRALESLGATVIDADQLAREVVLPGMPAYQAIVSRFGSSILNPDATLNRQRLAEIVFADEKKRRELEEITHPDIGVFFQNKILALRQDDKDLIVYDCPLLFEANLHENGFRKVVVVSSPKDVIRARLLEKGLNEEEISQRHQSQMPLSEKEALADVVIDNNDGLDELLEKAKAFLKDLNAGSVQERY